MKTTSYGLPMLASALLLLFSSFEFTHELLRYDANAFGDFGLYVSAALKYNNGANPYEITNGNLFVYSPLVLQAFGMLGSRLEEALIFFYVLASFLLAFSLSRHRLFVVPFLAGVSYLGLGILSFYTGNITLYLHFFLMAILLRGLSSKSDVYVFLTAVVLFSIVKPYLIVYLVIPCVIAYRRGSAGWLTTLKTGMFFVTYVFLMVLHYVAYPEAYAEFARALSAQTLTRGDLGLNLFSLFKGQLPMLWALLANFVVVVFLGCAVTSFYFKNKSMPEIGLVLFLYCFLTLINPRLKEYDIPIAICALFASCLVSCRNLRSWFFVFTANAIVLPHYWVKAGFFAGKNNVVYVTLVIIFLCYLINHALFLKKTRFHLNRGVG